MDKQFQQILPQEGTTNRGESLTEQSSVCPSYSGGDKNCSSLDLSGLAEAISAETETKTSWTVVLHKRPGKRAAGSGTTTTAKKGQRDREERSRLNRRARQEVPMPNKQKTTVVSDAAAETQRDPAPCTSTEAAKAQSTTMEMTQPPTDQPKRRRTPRGRRGRRPAAAATPDPAKEQPGTGSSLSGRASTKRARLDETRSPRGEAKRAKTDAKPKRAVSYADATQSHLRLAITTVPLRDLSQEQAELLRETIEDRILQAVLSPPSPGAQAPSFRGRPFLLDGALTMWCEDANARKWLEKTISGIPSPIPNTVLTVIEQSEMKKKLRAGLLLHTRITDAATLQRVLCAQNPWYKVDSWQCHDMTVSEEAQEEGSREKAVHLILGIPEDQKESIEARDRRVAHMCGSGYIRFFNMEGPDGGKEQPASDKDGAKETSTPEPQPSTSAPQTGQSEMEANSPLDTGTGGASEEEDVLCSP